jgi:hypothetical protein
MLHKWVPVEFATVGNMSLGTVQSLPFPLGVSDEVLQPGEVHLGGLQIRKIEIMVLDGVPEARWPEFVRAGMKQAVAGTIPSASALGKKP